MAQSRYLSAVLTVIAVLMGLNLWTTWTQVPVEAAPAYAQGTVDAGQQRIEIINQLKKLNIAVIRLEQTLRSGDLTVRTESE